MDGHIFSFTVMNKFFTDLRIVMPCVVGLAGWFSYALCDEIFVYLMLSKARGVEEITTSPRIDESVLASACVPGLDPTWVCREIADLSKARY